MQQMKGMSTKNDTTKRTRSSLDQNSSRKLERFSTKSSTSREMQVRHINVTMKAMFSRMKSLQEGAVISFNQVGDSHQQKEPTECNKCKGPLRNSESKEQQTPVCLQKDNAAQTEFWRNAHKVPWSPAWRKQTRGEG